MEEYRPIKDYPNYEVSNHGNVRNILTCKFKVPQLNNKNYYIVYLYKNNKQVHKTVHSLVAEAFLEKNDKTLIVDHIDRNRKNNALNNLRFVSKAENGMNSNVSRNNTSGTCGVYFKKSTNKWAAEIKINYKKKHLGYFINKEDAIKARKEAQDLYFGEYQKFNSLFERLQFKYKQLMKEFDKLLIEIKELDPNIPDN